MVTARPINILTVLLILATAVPSEAVTVNPLCPTNKIAPRKRFASWELNRGRTFAAFYDLLTPDRPNLSPYNDLQEKPQEDEPDDCGDIEDYDENDLSSVTPQSQRRQGNTNNQQFLGGFFNRPQYFNPTKRPSTFRPQGPTYRPTQPPFWSAGIFGSNPYRPPSLQRPSDYVKPVNENSQQVQEHYNPYVVGGPLGHVVGFTPIRPTTNSNEDVRSPRTPKYHPRFTTSTPATYSTKRYPRTRRINENSIFGSFIDLLFK